MPGQPTRGQVSTGLAIGYVEEVSVSQSCTSSGKSSSCGVNLEWSNLALC